jgi:hypothetical protein
MLMLRGAGGRGGFIRESRGPRHGRMDRGLGWRDGSCAGRLSGPSPRLRCVW